MLCKENPALSQEYKSAVADALKVLDKKNLALILHGVSFPSSLGENTGFGTYNSDGAKRVFDFMSGVFNALQLGPAGKTKISDPSPYCGTVFSKNPLFINLQALTTGEWEHLLSFCLILFPLLPLKPLFFILLPLSVLAYTVMFLKILQHSVPLCLF